MRQAFRTEIFRELRKSAGRFLGMLAIVALGVCVFAGLGSTGSTMKRLSDRYYREQRFMDIRLLCSYGLSEKDIDAIGALEEVELVQPAYNLDALTTVGDADLVLKLHSMVIGPEAGAEAQLNLPCLLSGRYPERGGEALVEPALLKRLGLEIGDSLRLKSGKSTDIRGSLRFASYRVVGTARSPLYYSSQRGSSSVGSGSVDYYMMIPREDFRAPVYSEAFVQVAGSRELDTYSTAYEDLMEQAVDRLEELAELRETQRKGELTRAGFERLEAAQSQLMLERAAAYARLDDGWRQLEETRRALSRSRLELAQGELEALGSREELAYSRTRLEADRSALSLGLEALSGAGRSLRLSLLELNSSEMTLLEKETRAVELKSELLDHLDSLGAGLEAAEQGLEQKRAELAGVLLDLEAAPGDPALTAQKALLEATVAELEGQAAELLGLYTDSAAGLRQLLIGFQELIVSRQELETGRMSLLGGRSSLEEARGELEGQRLLLLAGFTQLSEAALELEDAGITLEDSRRQIWQGERSLRAAAEELYRERDQAVAGLEAAQGELDAQRAALYDLEDPVWYVLDRSSNTSYANYDSDSDKIHAIGQLIPLLFFLVAALVSLTTMSRLVEEQRTEMGTLKALGYGSGRIMGKYALYAIVPTLLGSLAGGAIGQVVFPTVILAAYSSLYPTSPYGSYAFNIPYWAGGLALAVCSTLFTTIYACAGELRDVPSVLMRHKAPKVGKKNPLEYLTILWRRLSFLYKITFRNIFRYKKRLYMTIIGVSGCTALLVIGIGLKESVSGLVARQYGELQQYELTISFSEGASGGERSGLRAAVAEYPIARESAFFRSEQLEALVSGSGSSEDITLLVPQNAEEMESYFTLRRREDGAPLAPGDGVIISEKLSKLLGLAAGDQLVLRDSDDREFAAEITGVCEAYFMHWAYMTPDAYGRIFGEAPKLNTLYVKVNPGTDSEALSAMANSLLERSSVAGVTLTSRMMEQFDDTMSSLDMVIWVIILAAAALAFVVLLNLTNINITERAREIATIQVLGFRDGETSSYIYRENRIVAMAGALLGLWFGKGLHRYVMQSVEPSFVMFSPDLSGLIYLLSFVLTMAFVLCVDFITSGKLRKINMVEALKSSE